MRYCGLILRQKIVPPRCLSKHVIQALAALLLLIPPVQSAESDSPWIYPNSKLHAKMAPSKELIVAWPNNSIDVRSTPHPIEKVVAWYVERSGFEPPNWKVLGREYPSPIQLPVGFWYGPGKAGGGDARVSITHHFRPAAAQVTFLIVLDSGQITAISITRGRGETGTWIHVHEHGPRISPVDH